MTERTYPALLPSDGSLSTEQHQGQGWQNKHLFYGHPVGERPYAELIGDPVEQTILSEILRFWIERLGMSVEVRIRNVPLSDVADYIDRSRADRLWRGALVTGSLRQALKSHVSLLARDTDKLPFVDTVFRYELGWPGGLITAAAAFWKTLESFLKDARDFPLWFAAIQVVGSGPEAFAAAGGLREKQMDNFWFYTTDLDEGRALTRRLELGEERVLPLEALRPLPLAAQMPFAVQTGSPHFLINTTGLGRDGAGQLPINLDLYPDKTLVYDFVHEPRDTALTRRARERSMMAVNGLPLLIEQAAHAFWFFFLDNPPRKHDDDLIARLG